MTKASDHSRRADSGNRANAIPAIFPGTDSSVPPHESALNLETAAHDLRAVNAAVPIQKKRKPQSDELFQLAFEFQSNFIANMAHDLNTPIATLLLQAQTIDSRNSRPGENAFAVSISEEMRNLARSIAATLTTLGRLDRLFRKDLESCVAEEFITKAIGACKAKAATRQVTLDPVPQGGQSFLAPPVVLGESELLSLMMQYLIRNSIRASQQGQRVLVNYNISSEDSSTLEIHVRHFGQALSGTSPVRLGSTLSDSIEDRTNQTRLAMAAGIAELLGGTIHAANATGGGAEHIVRLPLSISRSGANHSPADANCAPQCPPAA